MQVTTELKLQLVNYKNTAECNDILWKTFAERTDGVEFLKTHRDWVEHNSWGYGARPFHYMWYLLLKDDVLTQHSPSLLEIGVYKGQVISLWALIAKQVGRPIEITAISPFEGSKPWFALKLKKLLGRAKRIMMEWSRYFRLGLVNDVLDSIAKSLSFHFNHYLVKDCETRSANFYEKADYDANVSHIFRTFGLQDADVTLIRGYSQDEHVRQRVAGQSFDIVYIDGGHRFEEVSADLTFYAPLVRHGGYLVVDDASCNLPGTTFWKGHASVSRAVEDWGAPGFANVLNIGHNRVYVHNT